MTGATYIEFDKARTIGLRLIRTGENPTFGLLVLAGIYMGLRISDLLNLTFKDLRSEKIAVTEQKTGKKRVIKVNDTIHQALNYFPKETYIDSFHAFRSQKNTVYSNKHVNRLLSKFFTGERLSSHSLRKTFGRRVWDMHNQSEAALVSLSDIFNHKDVATTRRYLGIRQEQIDDIYTNL